jgi:hypothetical protein
MAIQSFQRRNIKSNKATDYHIHTEVFWDSLALFIASNNIRLYISATNIKIRFVYMILLVERIDNNPILLFL